jgi:hypothetical protein
MINTAVGDEVVIATIVNGMQMLEAEMNKGPVGTACQ